MACEEWRRGLEAFKMLPRPMLERFAHMADHTRRAEVEAKAARAGRISAETRTSAMLKLT